MATKETLRYAQNDDVSTIRYKPFANSPHDTYPTFSFCFSDKYKSGFLYFFFKDEINYTIPILKGDYIRLSQILKGENVSIRRSNDKEFLDIRNISENHASMFKINFKQVYDWIEFRAEDENDKLKLNADYDLDEPLPFFVSYNDPDAICFTRNSDIRKSIVRITDMVFLRESSLKRFGFDLFIALKIFIHHPGQLLRVYNAPIYETPIQQRKLKINFKISQVSILRKRPDSNLPCNPHLYDDDLELKKQVLRDVGCIPIYWKNSMAMTSKPEICNNSETLKKIWNMVQNFTQIQSKYEPPCNEMKLTVTSDTQTPENSFQLNFRYLDKNYEEIVNEREFGIESLWSTVGGFVGIFVGTSLSQLPKLVTITWTWLRNLMR